MYIMDATDKDVADVLRKHGFKPNATSSGFLAVCECGEAVDNLSEHQALVIEHWLQDLLHVPHKNFRTTLYFDMLDCLTYHHDTGTSRESFVLRPVICKCGEATLDLAAHKAEMLVNMIKHIIKILAEYR